MKPETIGEIKHNTRMLARELEVIGLMNIQYAVKDDVIYVLEVNPEGLPNRPLCQQGHGRPLAKLATKVMMGRKL